MCDNLTILSYINNMGDIKSNSCYKIACNNTEEFCITKKIWISAAHIPGVSKKEADKQPTVLGDATDWQLNSELLKKICEKFVKPDTDVFIRISINN